MEYSAEFRGVLGYMNKNLEIPCPKDMYHWGS
jgi:hypothetical protein